MKVESRTRYSVLRGFTVPLMVVAVALSAQGPAAAAAEPPGPLMPVQLPLQLSNPEAYALAKDAGDALRYTLAAVADDLDRPYAAGTVEADLKQGLLSLPTAKRDRFVTVAKQTVRAVPTGLVMSRWGRHDRLTVEQFRTIGFKGAFDTMSVDAAALKASVQRRAQKIEQEEEKAEAEVKKKARDFNLDLSTQPKLKALDFRIDQVRAVEETDGWGSDEILMGGLQLDHTGASKKVENWKVSNDFDTGEVVNYAAPGRKFSNFSLTTSGAWPRSFVSVVMMAEEDSGGFAKAVNEAWTKVRGEVGKKITEAVGDFASVYVGAAIGELLGKVTAFLVDAIVDFVTGWFDDDLFDAKSAATHLPYPYEFMYNNPAIAGWTNHRLPTTQLRFVGHGGDYRVNAHWQVSA